MNLEKNKIFLKDMIKINNLKKNTENKLSSYTFSNLFIWQYATDWNFFEMSDHLVIWHMDGDENLIFFEPIGHDSPKIIKELKENFKQAKFMRLCENTANILAKENIICEYDPNNSDYIYTAKDMIFLEGRNYDAKRNHIKKTSHYNYNYEQINSSNIQECINFMEYWISTRDNKEDFFKENIAINTAFENFDVLKLYGGILRIDNKIAAFTFGEIFEETLIIHVEKGDINFKGIYQTIFNEFAKDAASNLKYINRQQDLGIPGIRKAKLSYHPHSMIKAFTL